MATNWTQKLKHFLVYFLGTELDKYIVDEQGRKIIVSLDLSFAGKTKNSAIFTSRAKN